MSSYLLSSPDILFGAGVIGDPELVQMTVACGGTMRKNALAPLPLRRTSAPVEAWWNLVPSYPLPDPTPRPALEADNAPRYLKHADQKYWFEYVPELAAIYFQFNRARGTACTRCAGRPNALAISDTAD